MNETESLIEVMRLRQKRDLLIKIKRLQRSNGIEFYRPHWKQHLYHTAPAKHRFLRGGNRVGKSDLGAAELVAWMKGERSWYRHEFDVVDGDGNVRYHHPGGDDHPFVRLWIPQRPVKILLIVQDWDKSTEIFTEESKEQPGKIWKMLPDSDFSTSHKNHSSAIDMIETKNGSRLHIDTVKSFMMNPMGMESSYWDLIWVDEPCPQKMFVAAARGLIDHGGHTSFALTPLNQPWINDSFIPNRMADEALKKTGLLSHGNRFVLTASMHDNPHLKAEDKADFLNTLTPEERECREKGLPLDRAGTIYKDFSYVAPPEGHVIYDPPTGWTGWTPPSNYCVYYAIDWHPSKPIAVLFCAVAPTGNLIFYSNLFEKGTHREVAENIKDVLGGSFVAGAVMDPLAWVDNPATGTNNADDLMSHGLFLDKAVKDPRRGIPRVVEELKTKGKIMVGAHLDRFLWEMDRFCWGDDGLPDKKGDFHMMENLYRIILHDPMYVEPPSGEEIFIEPSAIVGPDYGY